MTPVNASRNNVVFFEHLFLGVNELSIHAFKHLQDRHIFVVYAKYSESDACMLQANCLVLYFPSCSPSLWGLAYMQVGDMETAHMFYEQGLGLLYDPSVKSGQKKGVGVSWLNIGHQQVHYFFSLCCYQIVRLLSNGDPDMRDAQMRWSLCYCRFILIRKKRYPEHQVQ